MSRGDHKVSKITSEAIFAVRPITSTSFLISLVLCLSILLVDIKYKVSDEISITAGYEFNTSNTISAKTGKKKYKFDIQQNNFAWIADGKIEKKMIKSMKKGSRIMVTGYNKQNSQTIDHYSLMGFTKAYNAAKKNCT